MKGQPINVRLSGPVELLVRDEAERTGRSRSQVVEELADEAARMRLFPGIAFRGPPPRRAYLIGTGLDVYETASMLAAYGNDRAELLADHPLLNDRALTLAAAYAARFPDEIELHRRLRARTPDELIELYPFLRA